MNKKELLLHNIAAKYILGENVDIELEGKTAEIDALVSLLEVSKDLRKALIKEEKLEKISFLLEKKKQLTKNFEEISNVTWRL